jgi:alpha-amylase
MQGWYWNYPKEGCLDNVGTFTGVNWAVVLKNQVNDLKNAGFTYLWLPPLSRASFGNCSNGYDPQDLYDLGDDAYGLGRTGFGTRAELDQLITALGSDIKPVADVVYNHRDGGAAENNSAVKEYILNYQTSPKSTFPSDRYRIAIDLGGGSPFGAGDYYFKVRSKSYGYDGVGYKFYVTTLLKQGDPFQGAKDEKEPNGGSDCSGQFGKYEEVLFNGDIVANLGNDGTGCHVDEFHLNLTSSDFTSTGDKLLIYMANTGSYSDHIIYAFYYDPEGPTGGTNYNDLINLSQFNYQTNTDFTDMPSGDGSMNFENFRPNSGNAATTYLNGFWDGLWFFYDYDQTVATTQEVLYDWTNWLWNDVGIRGLRMDAVKHFPPEFVGDLLDDLHSNGIDPGLVVGEFYDGNSSLLKDWIDDVYDYMNAATKTAIIPRVFDFSLRNALKEACDNFDANHDVRGVFNLSIVDAQPGFSGFNVVTFVGNHDFRESGQYIQNDPILAYAYILTNNQIGLPCVFYPDYFTVNSYPSPANPIIGAQAQIDVLINVHKNYIVNSSGRKYLTSTTTSYDPFFFSGNYKKLLVYQLLNNQTNNDVIVAINFDTVTVNMWVDVDMSAGRVIEGATFGDRIGNSLLQTLTVSGGRVNIQLPARSYAVWVEGQPAVPVELISFTGEVEKNNVLLNWKTATEVNNYGFEIEKKSLTQTLSEGEGFKEWERIGFLNGSGNSNSPKYYSFRDNNLTNGKYTYRLKQIDTDGKFEYSNSLFFEITNYPADFVLSQNYPNPFNPSTKISWQSPVSGKQVLKIFDVLGNEVVTLVNEYKPAGSYEIEFQSSVSSRQLASGIYYYQLKVGEFIQTRKMILIR